MAAVPGDDGDLGDPHLQAQMKKKRSAGRQITKDDRDDSDEDAGEHGDGQGMWKRASQEEMAKRRIVKAKRRGAIAPVPEDKIEKLSEEEKEKNPFLSAQKFVEEEKKPAPANPFAGISFNAAPAASKSEKDDKTPSLAKDGSRKESPPVVPGGFASFGGAKREVDAPSSKETTSSFGLSAAATTTTSAAGNANPFAGGFGGGSGGFGSFNKSGGGFGSFGSDASKLAAPATGFAGFGSGSSIAGGASAGSSGGFGTVKGEGFALAKTKSSGSEDGENGGAGQVKAAPIGAAKTESNIPALQAEETVTGEEDEDSIFTVSGMLYEYCSDKTWKEKGRGQVHLNAGKKGQCRLVMRATGSKRLILNANLWPGMVVTVMDGKKGVTFACINHAGTDDKAEAGDQSGPTTFAVRIKSVEHLEQFVDLLNAKKKISTDEN